MTFTAYEKDYRKKGSKLIAGIDEVGRGSLLEMFYPVLLL